MKKIIGQRQLKFPVLNNVDYCTITKNKKSILEIDGKELEGMKWREFQIYLGKHLPPNRYYFTLHFKNNQIYSGQTKAVDMEQKAYKEDQSEINSVLKEFNSLKELLNKASNAGGVTFDMLLASTKQGYESQAIYLNQKISDLNETIKELKNEITKLDDELTECEKENSKSTGIAQYLAIGEKLASVYLGGKTKTPISLKESNTSDIPEEILQVLGVINWNLIDPESIFRIAENIQKYLSVLPQQYFKGQ